MPRSVMTVIRRKAIRLRRARDDGPPSYSFGPQPSFTPFRKSMYSS